MKLSSDIAELIFAEVMKRVFEPVDDDVPDPADYCIRKDLTKAEASKLIDEMRKKAGVG